MVSQCWEFNYWFGISEWLKWLEEAHWLAPTDQACESVANEEEKGNQANVDMRTSIGMPHDNNCSKGSAFWNIGTGQPRGEWIAKKQKQRYSKSCKKRGYLFGCILEQTSPLPVLGMVEIKRACLHSTNRYNIPFQKFYVLSRRVQTIYVALTLIDGVGAMTLLWL